MQLQTGSSHISNSVRAHSSFPLQLNHLRAIDLNRQLVHPPGLPCNPRASPPARVGPLFAQHDPLLAHPAAPNATQVLLDQLLLRFRARQRSRLPIEDCRRLQLPEKMPRRECSPCYGRPCSFSSVVSRARSFLQHEVTVALDSRKSVIDPCRSTFGGHTPSTISQSSLLLKRASSS